MNSRIIMLLLITVTFGGLSFFSFQANRPSASVARWTKENQQIAKQYHQLVKEHKALNKQYVEKHGYTSSETTTNGTLFIIPYHSESHTKVKVHTPAMVKIEYQQQDLKHRFDRNNDHLIDHKARPILLNKNNYDEAETVYFGSMASDMNLLMPWTFLIATIAATIMTLTAFIRERN